MFGCICNEREKEWQIGMQVGTQNIIHFLTSKYGLVYLEEFDRPNGTEKKLASLMATYGRACLSVCYPRICCILTHVRADSFY
jgi:hypothetical protein